MRLVTFTYPDAQEQPGAQPPRLGALLKDAVIDLARARQWGWTVRGLPFERFPTSMFELIAGGQPALAYVQNLLNILEGEDPQQLNVPGEGLVGHPFGEVGLLPPLTRPMSIRDFYAFEQHVVTAHQNRNKPVPEAWYQFPVFYFSNPNAIYGPGEVVPCPSYTEALDYEVEVACIIGQPGINIPSEAAEAHIFGYTIFNDWSARDVQRREMQVGLGPAKGKDFASSLGPWIVTPDELAEFATGRPGVYDRRMTARLNGEVRSQGNWKDLHYSFGEMIARASQDVVLLPGEVIGSGTVGSGCLLELTHGQGPWLKPGDLVELEIEGIGLLANRVGESRKG